MLQNERIMGLLVPAAIWRGGGGDRRELASSDRTGGRVTEALVNCRALS